MNKRSKGLIFIIASFIAALALFIILLDSLGIENILEIFLRVRFWHIGVIAAFTLFYLIIFVIKWQRILKIEGHKVPFKDLLFYRLAGFAVAYLTPAADFGGEPVMAYLLSKEYKKISFTASFASVIINRLVGLVSNITFVFLAFAYIFSFFILPEEVAFVFYIMLSLIAILFVFVYFFATTRKPLEKLLKITGLYGLKKLRRAARVEEFDAALNNFFHYHPGEVFISLGLSVLGTLSLVAGFWSLAYFLGFDLKFFEALIAWSVDSIVATMPVPANIGFAEAGESAWFSIMGIGGASGFSFYLIMRSKDILYALIGIIALVYKGVGKEIIYLVKETFRLNNSNHPS